MLAVRRPASSGWEVIETTRTAAARDDGLRALGLDPATTRDVFSYSVSRGCKVPDLAPVRDNWVRYSLHSRSCLYDDVAGCWRAPDEPVTEPDASPPRVERLGVVFGLPEAGWLPVTLTAAATEDAFEVSEAFDPFDEIVGWLVDIASGQNPRIVLNLEGEYVGLHVWPANVGHVRFAVQRVTNITQWTIDVVIERQSLVASIYAPLIACFDSPEFAAVWRAWFYTAECHETCPRPYPHRPAILDALTDR